VICCAMTSASIFKLKEVSRHNSVETLSGGDVKIVDLFADHAGAFSVAQERRETVWIH
jgi:hypothetical protein